MNGACLAVSCEGIKLQAGAGDHDKVAVGRFGPEEADDGALALPGTLQYTPAVIAIQPYSPAIVFPLDLLAAVWTLSGTTTIARLHLQGCQEQTRPS